MTIRTFATTLTFAAMLAVPVAAQTTTPRAPVSPRAPQAPAAPQAPEAALAVPPPPPPPRKAGQPVNIKIDVTITDEGRSGAQPLKKTVSIVTGDSLSGRIRSAANYSAIGNTPLNVDAEPEILSDGKIRVRMNLQYSLPGNVGNAQNSEIPGAGALRVTEIQENLSLILENGKPIVAAQSADPVGDRQVTIELKATILK